MAATAFAVLATAISIGIGGLVLEGVLRAVRVALVNQPPIDPAPARMPADFMSRTNEGLDMEWGQDLAA
jgi:hypothetical protein